MGRKDKKYKKSLHQQAYEKLISMQAFGESKRQSKAEKSCENKIFSYATYKTYWKHVKYFIKWMQIEHPECTTLKKSKQYVGEWLQHRVDEGLSAWTIQTEEAALNKLFQIKLDDPERFVAPKRCRKDIKRSRGRKRRDENFNEKTNEKLVHFCKACGFRRNILEQLKGKDLLDKKQVEDLWKKAKSEQDYKVVKACSDALQFFPEYNFFIIHVGDKGGKTRISPIIGEYAQQVIDRMKYTKPEELVWKAVNKNCDVHGYRADYATELYKQHARSIQDMDYNKKIKCADGKYRSEIYICRGDERGKKLDRKALHLVSVALGHNREDTAVSSYIRNL